MGLHKFLIIAWVCLVGASLSAAEPEGLYKTVVDRLQQFQQNNPTTSSVFTIGQNDDGVDIYAIRISTSPKQIDPRKIGQLLVATHHGNEQYAATLALNFTENLLARYHSAELYRGDIAQQEWTIVPVLNISGYNANDRYEHGVDPNRDYPGPCIDAQGGSLKSIQLMMKLLTTRIFTGSVTVHGYANSLTYPWGVNTSNAHTSDDNLYSQIVAKAAQLNGYPYGTMTEVVYPCDGAYEDFVYWKYGTWSLLVELKDGSDQDLKDTVSAVSEFYSELNASPSIRNQMTGQCQTSHHRDLATE